MSSLVSTSLITSRRVIFVPNTEIKKELARTSINITCYDRNGELVKRVTSICHRDYSILGTDIQVKLFDDHITVESPGILPGLVRPYNIREMHFSRNPKIALYMRSYKLVKEFGEGMDRMFREMEEAGLPAPEYRQNESTIRQAKDVVTTGKEGGSNLAGKEPARSWQGAWLGLQCLEDYR